MLRWHHLDIDNKLLVGDLEPYILLGLCPLSPSLIPHPLLHPSFLLVAGLSLIAGCSCPARIRVEVAKGGTGFARENFRPPQSRGFRCVSVFTLLLCFSCLENEDDLFLMFVWKMKQRQE